MPPQKMKSLKRDKVTRLAHKIFESFPREVSGLKFYILDCGCIYLQRVLEDGQLDPVIGIYRDPGEGRCELCTLRAVNWKEMVTDYVVVYNTKLAFIVDESD